MLNPSGLLSQHWITKLINAQTIIDRALNSFPPAPNFKKLLEGKNRQSERIYASLSTQTEVSNALKKVGDIASKDYLSAVSIVSGITTQALEKEKIQLPWLRQKTMATAANNGSLSSNQTLMREDYQRLTSYNPVAPTHIANLAQIAKTYPLQAVQIVQTQPNNFLPSPDYGFCLPLNPVLDSLSLWAELNLYKLRTCRNIAGIERELAPYAAPTDILSGLPQIGAGGQLILPGAISFPATPYRYAVLIERAKQLVSIAQQIEASFLSALEKLDAELYSLLKARQDMQSARAGVILQNLRVREAVSGVTLAELQKERSQIQVDHYRNLLESGITKGISWAEGLSGVFSAGSSIAAAFASGGTTLAVSAGAEAVSKRAALSASASANASTSGGGALASIGAIGQSFGSLLGQYASYERREQEWKFQRKLAQQDVRIGKQQIRIAQDRVRVVGQERVISQMQADFAEETLDFLTTKFSSAEFYDWMVGILEGVYSFFLQQATATAKLAENQLAFERQEVTPSYIQADYWEVPNDNFATSQNNNTPDQRGLTGSARLLQDIYQLDQYAFDTDRRKLQLTKTISLARLAPAEFQGFRETGVMLFSTPMELFDRDFPGHYLRLIKRVRTSIIALIPPTEGIKATLSTTGLSRVVTGQNNLFQTNEIVRPPESVALTSPRDATGLFELTPQSQEMLLPFENFGVDTSWELRLPKASNLFDYNTIADVLITIEYTALNSFTYRQTILDELGDTFSGDRPFSFRNQFADAWYDFNNPEQTDNPMVVTFETRREDFPANIKELKIDELVLYFARSEGEILEVPVEYLRFTNTTSQNDEEPIDGSVTTIDGVISTRRGNAPSDWVSMIGKTPFGKWDLALPYTDTTRRLFEEEAIEDILFVITYSGRIPQ